MSGATAVEEKMARLARNLGPVEMEKTMGMVVKGLEEREKKTWGKGVKTLPETRQRWPESSTLYNTGALKDSLTKSGAPGAVRKVTPRGFEFGSSLPHARWVNDGTSRQSAKGFFKVTTPTRTR